WQRSSFQGFCGRDELPEDGSTDTFTERDLWRIKWHFVTDCRAFGWIDERAIGTADAESDFVFKTRHHAAQPRRRFGTPEEICAGNNLADLAPTIRALQQDRSRAFAHDHPAPDIRFPGVPQQAPLPVSFADQRIDFLGGDNKAGVQI